jgi:SAM-dependent methyltransferase
MRESARARLLESLPDDAQVLDVGGWAVPWPRADWVIDLAPYESRGEWGYDGEREAERFSADTWVQRDICDREPWPFADDQFDFVVCSHTLEDVRDPVWVCHELARVAKAGYIEVPSRLEEQSYGFQGPWTGWGHHHWLIDIDSDAARIDFVFKHHVIHAPGPDHFPAGFHALLSEEEQVQCLWWTGSFEARERVLDTADALHSYLRDFVAAHSERLPQSTSARWRMLPRRSPRRTAAS